jgi:hypothetical protein
MCAELLATVLGPCLTHQPVLILCRLTDDVLIEEAEIPRWTAASATTS